METGQVYFILQTSVETNEQFYKIGFSVNPEKRLKELKTGNPNRLELKYTIMDVPMSFESHMHGVCERYSVDGEWYRLEVLDFLMRDSSPWFRENILRFSRLST